MNDERTVLLIDDDWVTLAYNEAVVRQVLKEAMIIPFESARPALAYLRAGLESSAPEPSLILTDLYMPDMDGLDFIDKFAHLPQAIRGRYRVFALSSSTDARDIDQLLKREGLSGFYTKPLTVEKMQELIKSVSCA